MYYILSNPIAELEKEFGNFFKKSCASSKKQFPPVNLQGKSDQIFVSVELPGINLEKLNITVVENTLTIEGEREPEKTKNILRQERHLGKFRRVIQTPFTIDSNKVVAKYEKGILSIYLEQVSVEKPKTIKIQSK